jgi:chorismate synthase
MEPTAAPISVLSVARRMRSSKTMMQIAITRPAPAEIQASLDIGFRRYPADIRNAGIRSRMRTTSACITKAYYHARVVASRKYALKQESSGY